VNQLDATAILHERSTLVLLKRLRDLVQRGRLVLADFRRGRTEAIEQLRTIIEVSDCVLFELANREREAWMEEHLRAFVDALHLIRGAIPQETSDETHSDPVPGDDRDGGRADVAADDHPHHDVGRV